MIASAKTDSVRGVGRARSAPPRRPARPAPRAAPGRPAARTRPAGRCRSPARRRYGEPGRHREPADGDPEQQRGQDPGQHGQGQLGRDRAADTHWHREQHRQQRVVRDSWLPSGRTAVCTGRSRSWKARKRRSASSSEMSRSCPPQARGAAGIAAVPPPAWPPWVAGTPIPRPAASTTSRPTTSMASRSPGRSVRGWVRDRSPVTVTPAPYPSPPRPARPRGPRSAGPGGRPRRPGR